MSFIFPSTPTVGQQVSGPNGFTYQWDGKGWVTLGGGGGEFPEAPTDGRVYGRDGQAEAWDPVSRTTTSTSPPPDPLLGDFWYNSATGHLLLWDGDNWVSTTARNLGVIDGSNPSSDEVGFYWQYISGNTSVAWNSLTNVCQTNVPPGDWDIYGFFSGTGSVGAQCTSWGSNWACNPGRISPGNLGSLSGPAGMGGADVVPQMNIAMTMPVIRISTAISVMLYVQVIIYGGGGSYTFNGRIAARRVR